jgi:hypothetical protein
VNQIDGQIKLAKGLLEEAENTNSDDFAASFAQQVAWCKTFTTKEKARQAGCNYAGPVCKPGERDPRHTEKIAELKQQLDYESARLPEAKLALADAQAAQERTTKALQIFEANERRFEQERNKASIKLEAQRNLVLRYLNAWNNLEFQRRSLMDTEKELAESLKAQQEVRQQIAIRRTTLSEHFDRTLKKLAGHTAGGKIMIDGRGLFPTPNDAVGAAGEAMGTSTTVLGFDLACLTASICGLGYHPRFLLHDSPREADMEQAMYDMVFNLALELEKALISVEPSFQYIITTTTPPPPELSDEGGPFVRISLNGRDKNGLLLGERF